MRLASYTGTITAQCRRITIAANVQCVPVLPNDNIETFRKAFNAGSPVLLPRQALQSIPAIRKWFITSSEPPTINGFYLARYGSALVPLELSDGHAFARTQQPFSYFLDYLAASYSQEPHLSSYRPGERGSHQQDDAFYTQASPTAPQTRIYLAQASIADLPEELRADLPVPELVKQAGKGDIYDSSIWIGRPPTDTPLHKDPNPNLFVQLAGSKVVRLFTPEVGRGIFAKIQEMIGGDASQSIRGEEMMQGAERKALDWEVWSKGSESRDKVHEAHLSSGDALFIPKGWWHSIRSSGSDINGSVNWWFR